MARILVSEPHKEVQGMLERMLTRLGHEPILAAVPSPEQLYSAELLLVEPTAASGAVLAQTASVLTPTLPVICASVAEPPAELAELGVVFSATLIKPFTAQQLEDAIDNALAGRRAALHANHSRRS